MQAHLADLERADRFRDLERHLEAGVQGEGGWRLARVHPIH